MTILKLLLIENIENMKTLVIHPKDSSTTFLSTIYEPVTGRTVVSGGITKEQVLEMIASHDRIMMMGHGSPWGLLAVDQFPGSGMYIIDYSMAQLLKVKRNNVFIWCNADKYVDFHNLEGFYSGMFVSELHEAHMMGLNGTFQSMVDESNKVFGPITARYINEDPESICRNVKRDYGLLSNGNPVILYNSSRLYYRTNNT